MEASREGEISELMPGVVVLVLTVSFGAIGLKYNLADALGPEHLIGRHLIFEAPLQENASDVPNPTYPHISNCSFGYFG